MALGWFALDQLTKLWALHALEDSPIPVVWTLRFDLAYNSGASFSLGTGMGPWIALGTVIIVGFLLHAAWSTRSGVAAVAFGLIVGGALGNLADRLLRSGSGFLGGSVVDFIDLQWWPVFNLADVGVVCGAILLIVTLLRGAV
ncbi:MAG: signal peptidase II [Acidobacteria bacterium]|nr:signal peptidase II [Acidobacteriota bacterium]